jgi:oligopeptide/dipeptide ABC transporter ATP-binding protein
MRFADVSQITASYPHEISGGMAQRVAIAMTLARRPRLIVADEPTAALDASVKAEVLDLLVAQCRAEGVSLLLVTHDLATVRRHAEKVGVMYAGRIVECGPAAMVFAAPKHPYTRALFAASVGQEVKGARLVPIPGLPPILNSRQTSCAFAARCRFAVDVCRETRPEPEYTDGRQVACLRLDNVEAGGTPA